MLMFNSNMSKVDFMRMATEIVDGKPKLGYTNKTLGLRVNSFVGWEDWFEFGVCPDANTRIVCWVEKDNIDGIEFLKSWGFEKM